METVTDPTSQAKKVFKFSEPLLIINPKVDSKNVVKNEGTYKFSQPLDVLSGISIADTVTSLGTPPANNSMLTGFGNQFKRSRKEWECNVCMVYNTPEMDICVACKADRKATTLSVDTLFGQQFKKSTDKWECETCMLQNTEEKTKCIACETPRRGSFKSEVHEGFKTLAPRQKASKWEFSGCTTQNDTNHFKYGFTFGFGNGTNGPTENDLRKASTSETAQEPATELKFGVTGTNTTPSDTSFKALASQQKASKWECKACMTQNDNNCFKCVCCEQGKPGHTKKSEEATQSKSVSGFTFGFGNGTNGPTENDLRKASTSETAREPATEFKFGFANTNTTPSDASFKALASQQKASKWECTACLTQNENKSDNCVCCEQQKPGQEAKEKLSRVPVTPTFTFGFGNVNNVGKTTNSEPSVLGFKTRETMSWECDTCLVRNKPESTKCICCESIRQKNSKEITSTCTIFKEIGTTTKFKFNFENSNTAPVVTGFKTLASQPNETNEEQLKLGATPADDEFKALAAQQKASKWECDACMTRNDITLVKCACCEQVKPGEKAEVKTSLQNEVTIPKFRFGFGDGNNAPTEEELRKKL